MIPLPKLPKRECRYPQSHAIARTIRAELGAVATNKKHCTSFYVDTLEGMSNDVFSTEGTDHHQGIARSHKLSDGSIYFFLTHSELDAGDQGSLSSYRYGGPTDNEHVIGTNPLTVAPMKQIVMLDERHPADIDFLPDVNELDAGYVFVAEEYDRRRVTCYRWNPSGGLVSLGPVLQGLPAGGPDFLFIDRVENLFYLGIASDHWGWGQMLCARDRDLFPVCARGSLDVSAFTPVGKFSFPVHAASQVKLIRDIQGAWHLLGFRGADKNGPDFVDVYGLTLRPFNITSLLFSVHIFLNSGDTGFASTGTHHVESSGRILISSSYRWAKDEGPGNSSFVSRVDECPSS